MIRVPSERLEADKRLHSYDLHALHGNLYIDCDPFNVHDQPWAVDRCRFPTVAEARREVFRFIEGFYNTRRLHSALGYESPANYENNNRAA